MFDALTWQSVLPIVIGAFVGGVALAFLLLPPLEELRPPFLDESAGIERAELDWAKRRLTLWAKGVALKSYRLALSPAALAEPPPRPAAPLRLWRAGEGEGDGFQARQGEDASGQSYIVVRGVPRARGWLGFLRDPAATLTESCVALSQAEVRELRRVLAEGTPLTVAG